MPGLAGTASAFESGFKFGEGMLAEKRQQQQTEADELRRAKAADLKEERENLRAQLQLNPNDPQLNAALNRNFLQRDLLYDPVRNPGALQKDWNFLKGLVWRKGKKPAEAPEVAASTAHDQTIRLGDQSIARFDANITADGAPTPPATRATASPTADAKATGIDPKLAGIASKFPKLASILPMVKIGRAHV